jgi:hypothetical protein
MTWLAVALGLVGIAVALLREFREQPFGGYLSGFREIAGYRLPMHVEGGNLIGTEDYFPFYKAEVERVRFPQLEG